MSYPTKALPIEAFLDSTKNVPVLDVRTSAEFEKGHIPNALNLPLFTDEERADIGTLYKQKGHEIAVKEGLKFIGPKLHSFVEFVEKTKSQTIGLYCWRGGMRSGSMAWLLQTAGYKVHLLEGGYKSYRKLIKHIFEPLKIIIISGNTGGGKTELLFALQESGAQILNLEEIAHHKGSAFGAIGEETQPTTEQFQNDIIDKVLELNADLPVFVEDESISIGKVVIPDELFAKMSTSPWLELKVPKLDRVKRLVREYGGADKEVLEEGVKKIKKRLGGMETKQALEALKQDKLEKVASILLVYYDRIYQKGIKLKKIECLDVITVNGRDLHQTATGIIDKHLTSINKQIKSTT